jgi:trans-2,3-dihydro-3-hydroxyanthranilate isomerase
MGRRVITVDVFAEKKLAGNQLAVVLDAEDLDTDQMQAIALEMNYSETTFVVSQSEERAHVRIFTPAYELPFAGHPSIGTAWVLAGDKPCYTLELQAGDVFVEFDQNTGICWMTPPKAELGEIVSSDIAASIAGLSVADLDATMSSQMVDIGPNFLIVAIKDLATLKRVRMNLEALESFQSVQGSIVGVFLFCSEAYSDDANFAARMLFEAAGVREDPATGSANAGFASYLKAVTGKPVHAIVEQGFEIGRPSRIYIDADETLKVGGKVFQVLQAELV